MKTNAMNTMRDQDTNSERREYQAPALTEFGGSDMTASGQVILPIEIQGLQGPAAS